MGKPITQGWAIKMTPDGGVPWWRYSHNGMPWKRRTEPANLVRRINKGSIYKAELYKVHMFYEPNPVE